MRVEILEKGQTPYVGDFVDFSAEDHSEGYILAIHDRKTVLFAHQLSTSTKRWLSCQQRNLILMPIC